MSKVFICAGHGGVDSGAVGNGFKESDLNLSIATACTNELTRNGVTVLMSRTKDENVPLTQIIKNCNNFNPDLAVDIHNNSGGGKGVEVFYYSGGGTSKTLALNILNEIVALGQTSRGIKTKVNSDGTDYFAFIRDIKAPSVIVECAFIDNAEDIKIVNTPQKQKLMGIAIAKGILKTLGITPKEDETSDGRGSQVYQKDLKTPYLAVYIAKKILLKMGYKMDDNGYFGGGTQSALIDIQKKAGITQSGKLDANTVDAIFKFFK